MATVEEVTAKYGNFLIRVLPAGVGVCAVCRTVVTGDWSRCYQCNNHRSCLSYTADAVASVALSAKGGQWAYELSAYKNSPSLSARNTLGIGLSAVLWRWLDGHEDCVRRAAGVASFPIVTSIPSTGGRLEHPLPGMLSNIVGPTMNRYVELLQANPKYAPGMREAHDDRFTIRTRFNGEPVLVIDDQWTSGGRAQSAASGLRLAGSGPVAVVEFGRHFDLHPQRIEYRAAAENYYQAAHAQTWDWHKCCLELS